MKILKCSDHEHRLQVQEDLLMTISKILENILEVEKLRGQEVGGLTELTGRLTTLIENTPPAIETVPGEPYHR